MPLIEKYHVPPLGYPHSNSQARSPTLSLFPPASSTSSQSPHRRSPRERRPLQRSATVQELTSPQRPSFEQDLEAARSSRQQQVVLVVRNLPDDIMSLEKPKMSSGAPNPSNHALAAAEARFHSAPETPELDAVPKRVGHSKFPIRTTSAKEPHPPRTIGIPLSEENPPSRTVANVTPIDERTEGDAYQNLSEYQPLSLNPPTPRLPPERRTGRSQRGIKTGGNELSSKHYGGRDSEACHLVKVSNKGDSTATVNVSEQYNASKSVGLVARRSAASKEQRRRPRPEAESVWETDQDMSTSPEPPASRDQAVITKPWNSQNHADKPKLPPVQQLPPLSHPISNPPDKINNAAEKSIARQISVSQRQRDLLVPVVPKLARQPTQVDIRGGTNTRKSEHLVLDNV